MNRRQIRDITGIMDVEAAMIPLLGRFESPNHMLNPWGQDLLPSLRRLALGPDSRVLDVPCGTGGVAVLVAETFGARVRGFDLLPAHIERAVAYATRAGCAERCEFSVGDLRECLRGERGYDCLLWVAGPHLWPDSAAAVRALRRCVRPGGTLFVADSYRPDGVPEALCPGYQSFADTTSGFGAAGDAVVYAEDLATDWERDFQQTHRAARNLLATLRDPAERRVLRRHIAELEDAQERESMGCGLWQVQRGEG